MPRAVNLLGVPFDGAVLGRKGAAGGPSGIRSAMSGFSNFNVELGIGLENARIFDLGDLVVNQIDVLVTHEEIEREVGKALDGSSLLVLMGGDNSISLPALKAFAKKFGDVGLVVVDSHLDLRGKIAGKPTSGSSYGLAVESIRELDPRRVAEIGAHGFLNSETYARKADRLGITIFPADQVRTQGPSAVAAKAYSVAASGAKAVYISVDLDAVDAAWVSGVSAPSSGGLAPNDLFKIVYILARMPNVGCLDLVELAPSLDPSGRSQVVAATALTYAFAGFAARRRVRSFSREKRNAHRRAGGRRQGRPSERS